MLEKKTSLQCNILKAIQEIFPCNFLGGNDRNFYFSKPTAWSEKISSPYKDACRLLKVIKRESSQEKPMFRTLCFAFLSDSIFFFQVFTNGMYDCKSLTMRKYFSFRRQKRNSKLIKYFIYSPQRWQ